jgi:ArsR family transcriptional regulator
MAEAIPEQLITQMAETFRLLADPSRLTILRCLLELEELNVGQVVEATGREQANVSKHLKLMAEKGLLARRKEGLQVYYQIQAAWVEQVCRLVSTALLEHPKL